MVAPRGSIMSRMVPMRRRNIRRNLPGHHNQTAQQFAIEINLFESREEVIPVTLASP